MTIKFGIIGASGIGYIHAQHFIQLGVNVVAILCSSELSAKNVSKKLALTFNIKVSPYYNLKDFLNEELDAVSICSPPNLHFYHIEACFNKNIKVFCEKPLFWNDSITKIDLMEKISFLESHKNRSLFVNTSNTVFLDAISKTESKKAVCYCFSFEFFTNGKNEGISIAEDLLPHGISLLIHKMGKRTITKYTCSILKNAFKCSFYYGECKVKFDFQEDPTGPKHMNIKINNNSFTRIQTGSGPTYKVSLINDSSKELLKVVDPFQKYITRFLDYVINSKEKDDDFINSALNLNLMAKCLDLSNKN